MKLRTCIVLLVLFMMSPALADFTVMVGENITTVDLGSERLGWFEAGPTVAMDYFADQSQPLKNFHLLTGDTYIGAFVKIHLSSKDDDIDPYVGVRAMSRDLKMEGSGAFEALEGGVNWFPKGKNLGLGSVVRYCDKLKDKWWVSFGVPYRFR